MAMPTNNLITLPELGLAQPRSSVEADATVTMFGDPVVKNLSITPDNPTVGILTTTPDDPPVLYYPAATVNLPLRNQPNMPTPGNAELTHPATPDGKHDLQTFR